MKTRSPITTHILDTTRGKPATNVAVVLERQDGKNWQELARGATNDDGRVESLLPAGTPCAAGTYRLTFHTESYFQAQGTKGFYPHVQVVFRVEDGGGHYHVPLLLNPFGYSTYRGS